MRDAAMWLLMAAIGFVWNVGCANTCCIRRDSVAASLVLALALRTTGLSFRPGLMPFLAISPSVDSSVAKSENAALTPFFFPLFFILFAVATRIFSRNFARFVTFLFWCPASDDIVASSSASASSFEPGSSSPSISVAAWLAAATFLRMRALTMASVPRVTQCRRRGDLGIFYGSRRWLPSDSV